MSKITATILLSGFLAVSCTQDNNPLDDLVSENMFFSPDTKLGVIIFQNSGQGNQFKILEKIYRIAREN